MREHSRTDPQSVPVAALRVVSSSGRALEPSTRATMEARFGHDFSRIRVHDDSEAAASAHSLGARAYSVGPHLVFGRARYAPGTQGGDALLAHELAHAVQHDRHGPATGGHGVSESTAPDEREAARAASQVAGGGSPAPLQARPSAALHRQEEPGSPTDELAAYLRKIRRTRRIEGDNDSDDKAVRIVRRWRAGMSEHLDGRDKAILIWELLDGPTTGPDEEAIVEILERSSNEHLDKIFWMRGEQIQIQIAEDVPDGEDSQLADFCRRRWVGGIEAFRKGQGYPREFGRPIPIGAPLPKPRKGAIEEIPVISGGGSGRPSFAFQGGERSAEAPKKPAGETVTPAPFGQRPPFPGTGSDALKAPMVTEMKDKVLAHLEKVWNTTSTAEKALIVVNMLVTAGFMTGIYAGAMSEQQRLDILNLFISDRDQYLQRPLDEKVITSPVIRF